MKHTKRYREVTVGNWRFGLYENAGEPQPWEVVVDGAVVFRSSSREGAMDELRSRLTLPAIENPEVAAALRAIRAEAKRLEAREHGYPMVSVRSLATRLGYEPLVPEILRACAEGGFTYCLDHTIEATSYGGGEAHTGRPSPDVCYWGPDQLRSRLDCVDYRVYS